MSNKVNRKIAIVGTLELRDEGIQVAPLLAKEFISLGHQITTISEADVLVSFNHNWTALKKFNQSNQLNSGLRVLIRLEPSCVYPMQYKSKVTKKYQQILSPGREKGQDQIELRWPYEYQENPAEPLPVSLNLENVREKNLARNIFEYETWKSRMILCSMIAANKISPDGSGNYGLRSSLARKLVSDDFRVFGNLWNVSIAKKVRYRLAVLKFNLQSGLFVNPVNIFSGIFTKFDESIQSIPNKHTVIEQSKFSLVIENSNDYLSEKLIDALIGGSIPIFLGPNLNNTPIPNHCVFRLPANPNDLTQFLKELDPLLIQSKLANIKSFLESDDFLEWDSMRIYRNIASIVNDKLEASKNLW